MKLLRIVIISLIIIFFGGFLIFTFQNDPQEILLNFISNDEISFALVLALMFILILLSTLTGLPVLYFSVALGFMLEFPVAMGLSWGLNLIAVMSTFMMVKLVYHDYFKERYGKKRIIQGINRRIKKYGLWTVAFARGIYVIPTNIINFSFPLSKIHYRQYALGTMIGLIPEVLINVTTGYLLKHQLLLLSDPQQNIIKIAVIGAFMLMLIGVILFIRYRRRKVAKARINEIVPKLREDSTSDNT